MIVKPEPPAAPPGHSAALAAAPDQALLAERRVRHAELMERRALRRADDAEAATREATARMQRLEQELADARRDGERLRAGLEQAERKRQQSDQLAHSEAAIRLELEREHAARLRRHQAEAATVLELLQAVQARARGLAREVEALGRAADAILDQAPPAVAVAAAASEPVRAAAAAYQDVDRATRVRARVLCAELTIARSTQTARAPTVAADLAWGVRRLRDELEQERSARAGVEAQWAQDRLRATLIAEAIEGVGRQLDRVRAVGLPAPAGTEAAAARPTPQTSAPTGERPDPPAQPDAAVTPDRLAAALHRLREELPAPASTAESPVSDATTPRDHAAARHQAALLELVEGRLSEAPADPAASQRPPADPAAGGHHEAPPDPDVSASRIVCWLAPTMKRLLRQDPALAGSLVIQLLSAQRLVARSADYDLALADAGCMAVTVQDGEVRVERRQEPRQLGESGSTIEGDLAGLGRLLVYGPLRRRLSRRVASVRGDRGALRDLQALVKAPLSLGELVGAGVRLDPELTLQLVACMIDPSWTRGERFTLGHESRGAAGRAYLLVRDGASLLTSEHPPLGPVATTILCPGEQLLTLLADGSAAEATVLGAAGPVALLRGWIARAQRG